MFIFYNEKEDYSNEDVQQFVSIELFFAYFEPVIVSTALSTSSNKNENKEH